MTTVPGVCLVILDGWGLAPDGPGNAISLADTPVFDKLWETYDHTQLIACGEAVGLPPGQMGNSEVGHLNLGAGAVVKQDLMRINEAVEDGSLAENEVILAALHDAPRVHLIGLVSEGGVHSSAPAPEGADRAGRAGGRRGPRHPRVHRRARHGAEVGGEDARDGAGVVRGGRRRPHRLGDRALPGDGPRHALGPHGEGR